MLSTQKILDFVRNERKRIVLRRQDDRLADANTALILIQQDRINELERELAKRHLQNRYFNKGVKNA